MKINEKVLAHALKRLVNEGRERVLEYFNRLAESKTSVAQVAFDCPMLPQEMRQRIMEISKGIDAVMDEMIEQGYVDEMDKPGVEFRSNQFYEHMNETNVVVRESENYWNPEEFVDYEEYAPFGISGSQRAKNSSLSDDKNIPYDSRCPFCDKGLKNGNYKTMTVQDDGTVSRYYYNPAVSGEKIKVGNGCFKNLNKARVEKYKNKQQL